MTDEKRPYLFNDGTKVDFEDQWRMDENEVSEGKRKVGKLRATLERPKR